MDAIRILSDPRRREILRLVWDDELSAGEISSRFDVSFGAISQHLRRLRDAGFVTVRREGNFRFYRADTARLAPFEPALRAMWEGFVRDVAHRAETEL